VATEGKLKGSKGKQNKRWARKNRKERGDIGAHSGKKKGINNFKGGPGSGERRTEGERRNLNQKKMRQTNVERNEKEELEARQGRKLQQCSRVKVYTGTRGG